jgi:hypothetical protein
MTKKNYFFIGVNGSNTGRSYITDEFISVLLKNQKKIILVRGGRTEDFNTITLDSVINRIDQNISTAPADTDAIVFHGWENLKFLKEIYNRYYTNSCFVFFKGEDNTTPFEHRKISLSLTQIQYENIRDAQKALVQNMLDENNLVLDYYLVNDTPLFNDDLTPNTTPSGTSFKHYEVAILGDISL